MSKIRNEQPCQSAVSACPQISRITAVAQGCSDHLQQAALYLASAQLSIARATGQMYESDKRMLARITSDIRLRIYALETTRSIQVIREQKVAAETEHLFRVGPRKPSIRTQAADEPPRAEVLP